MWKSSGKVAHALLKRKEERIKAEQEDALETKRHLTMYCCEIEYDFLLFPLKSRAYCIYHCLFFLKKASPKILCSIQHKMNVNPLYTWLLFGKVCHFRVTKISFSYIWKLKCEDKDMCGKIRNVLLL